MINQKKIVDAYGVQQAFAETIGRIEQIGANRRLTFVTRNPMEPDIFEPVVIVVISDEALRELAQMAAADRPMPVAFTTMPATQLAN